MVRGNQCSHCFIGQNLRNADLPESISRLQWLTKREAIFSNVKIKGRSCQIEARFGPAIYHGVQWVGRTTAVMLEIWRQTKRRGLRSKIHTLLNLQIVNSHDRVLSSLGAERLHSQLKDTIGCLAKHRYAEARNQHVNLISNQLDQGYCPENSNSSKPTSFAGS